MTQTADQQEKPRIPFETAITRAHELRRELLPCCERVWIAGSVRRRRETVGDIELVCIPKPGDDLPQPARQGQADLFGGVTEAQPAPEPVDQLTAYLDLECSLSFSKWSKRPNKNGGYTFGAKNKLLMHGDIAVDVFSATWGNFGMVFFVRTGDAGWVKEVMAQFKTQKQRGHPYGGVDFYVEGVPESPGAITATYLCDREESVFDLLGWPFVNPWDRTEEAARNMRRKFH